MKKILLIIAIVGAILAGGATNAHAAITGGNSVPTSTGSQSGQYSVTPLKNPLKVESIQEIIYLLVDIAVYVGAAFAVLAIIYVGFKFVMAQGNSDKIKEAKMWLLYIVIGLAILISAKVIVEIVKNTLVNSGVVDKTVFTLPN